MTKEKSKPGMKLSYLLIGGGIGAVIALLFAPKAGQKLRSDIADATRQSLDKAEELGDHLGKKAGAVYEDTRTKAEEIYDTAKQKINAAATAITEMPGDLQHAVQDKVGQIASSIEAGKKEYDREGLILDRKTATHKLI